MTEQAGYHMTPDEFRRYGRMAVDWIADYMEHVEEYPVLSQAQPGEIRAMLPPAAPAHGEPFEAMLADMERVVMPGITHWQSPNFFAYFPSNNSGPSILGDLLSAGLGVQGMLWATSPACTEIETHVLDWLVDMLALPEKFKSSSAGGGVIQDTASSSALTAILAARERATGFRSNTEGYAGGAGCSGRAGRLHLDAGAFVHREGDRRGRDRARQPAGDRRGRELRDARRRPGRADSRRPRRRADPVLRLRDGGHDLLERDRPAARHRRDLPRGGAVAARGRGDERHGGDLPGVPLDAGRAGGRRQLLLQPAQVDVHQLRLRRASTWPTAPR